MEEEDVFIITKSQSFSGTEFLGSELHKCFLAFLFLPLSETERQGS